MLIFYREGGKHQTKTYSFRQKAYSFFCPNYFLSLAIYLLCLPTQKQFPPKDWCLPSHATVSWQEQRNVTLGSSGRG